jgi:arginyl-tRNA synthetase
MQNKILSLLLSSLQKLQIENKNIFLETPENPQHGDYSCNIAMQLVKELKKNPRQIAQEIIENIPENTVIEKTEIAGPGFINFFLAEEFCKEEFLKFSPEKKQENPHPKKILIDFSSPNIAKPLHVGHLRSTIIGDSLQRIFRHLGHSVTADNFLGDWGTAFGKLVVAIEKWGDMEQIKENPIPELIQLYKKFSTEAKENENLDDEAREAFRKIEQDEDTQSQHYKKLWKWIVEVTLTQLNSFYQELDIHFDQFQGESFYVPFNDSTIAKVESVGEISEGALVVKFPNPNNPEKELMPPILFRRSDGATLYQTRDLSKILYYQEKNFDELLYVVAHEQQLHFKQLFETAKKLDVQGHLEHISFGLVLGADGKKFSTRKGNGVGLEEVFDEAKERVEKIIEQRGKIADLSKEEKQTLIKDIAYGSIKFNDLSQNRTTDIVFNWEKMLSFEGFSAPFLQYSHARAKSILRKSEEKEMKDLPSLSNEETLLVKKIIQFPEIVAKAGNSKKPNIIAEYLFQLAKSFNTFYHHCPILKEDIAENTKNTRLFLTKKFAQTLKTGLNLLGINVPEKM